MPAASCRSTRAAGGRPGPAVTGKYGRLPVGAGLTSAGMRSPPDGLAIEDLLTALAQGWDLRAAALAYVPEGGGSYHWKLDVPGGRASVAAPALGRGAGLGFVRGPGAAGDGEPLQRLDDRYAVSVWPYLDGRS